MKLNRFFSLLIMSAVTLLFFLAGQGAWAATTKTVTYTITNVEWNLFIGQYSIVFTRSGDAPFNTSATTYTTQVKSKYFGLTSSDPCNFSVDLADGFSLRMQWVAGSNVGFTNNCIVPGSGKQITYSVSCNNYYYISHLTLKGNEGIWRDADIAAGQSWPSSSITSGASLGSVTITYTDTPDIGILASDGENAYKIQSKHDLRHLANYVNKGKNNCEGLTFRQTQNITCDNSYTPIGNLPANQSDRFWGTYDGQGHRISGVTVTRTGSDDNADGFIGLFGVIGKGGMIKNVVLANSNFTGHRKVGSIAGQCEGTVQNCRVESTVIIQAGSNGAKKFGGIVGEIGGSIYAQVIGCVCAATVSSNGKSDCKKFGGIVGNENNGLISNCLYTGISVDAPWDKGAILGDYESGGYKNNYFTNINIAGVSGTTFQNGARRAHTVTFGKDITLVGDETAYDVSGLTAIGTGNYALRYFDGTATTLYSGVTHKLTFRAPTGYTATFSVNGTPIDGNTFTMPEADITVSATLTPATTITIAGHQHEGFYWTTFYHGTFRYTLPEGVAAYTMGSDRHLYRLGVNGRTIPKNTAVVIIADCADITLMLDGGSATVVDHAPGGNQLLGSNDPIAVSSLFGTPLVLSLSGTPATMGFRPYTGTSIPAGKAYYIVTQ
ncbi:MAG: hypothetical protein J5646_08880 [Bacteroidales bacterium]|nr:hypothetical protein [Bacteroidales bacterium]MBR4740045.1 hypothetical protein [Bacteroidales bacterium]